jgi:hypothetical protein
LENVRNSDSKSTSPILEPIDPTRPTPTPVSSQPSKSSSNKLKEERAKSAFAAAFHNFQTAKKMAQDNLDHQPLPDAILDKKFTDLQAQGDPNPGLGLDVDLKTTGLACKGYKIGPTQCTKLKVYRPKTCGVLPKYLDKSTMMDVAGKSQFDPKIGPMDLAIRWDYRPKNREPKLPKHIDGSNDIVPSVFTLVQQHPDKENLLQFERSEGVFHNTQGEIDFFDRDLILKRKDYQRKYEKERDCTCGTDVASFKDVPGSANISNKNRPKTTKSDSALIMNSANGRRYKSSPNLSLIPNIAPQQQDKDLNNNNINEGISIENEIRKIPVNNLSRETNEQKRVVRQPRYANQTIPRLCHLMKHDYEKMMKKYFLTNELLKLDENNNSMMVEMPPPIHKKQPHVHVPKPKQPYKKKNYQIDSLAPPFSSWTGRDDEFPNHLRLTSIYQQAYKPTSQRKRPFIQSIYR